jgi:hypothetical protein
MSLALEGYRTWGAGPGVPDDPTGNGYGTPFGICPRCHCCPETCQTCSACGGKGGDCCLGLSRALICDGGCNEAGVHAP